MAQEPEHLERAFRHFAVTCEDRAPLYAALSAHVAGDPELLALAAGGRPGQPAPNLLFGAVHALLLAGVEHPLAAFYPSLGGAGRPGDAAPAFADFCRRHRDDITAMVTTRLVQTNEVGRCAILLPAVALAGEPCHLIEIGASAGLNLLLDRYRYEYVVPGGAHTCGPGSPVRLSCEVQGEVAAPLPHAMPAVAGRSGVDLEPVDVTGDDAARWIEALVWPDQTARLERLRAACAVVRAEPPRLVRGDAIECLPGLVGDVDAGAVPVIVNSFATFQATQAWRDHLDALLADLAARRDLVRISMEWLGDEPGPRLHMTRYRHGQASRRLLAEFQFHGARMTWLDVPT